MKIQYVGGAKGQSDDGIEIGGVRFVQGEDYDLSEAEIKRLKLRERGGFTVPPKAKKPRGEK